MKFGRPLLIEVAATFIESGLPDFVGSLKIQAKIIVKYCKIRLRAWAVGDNRPLRRGQNHDSTPAILILSHNDLQLNPFLNFNLNLN